MLKLSNLGIFWKILTLVGVLSTLTIGGTIYSTNSMSYIDNSYGVLLETYGKANLAMARANRNLVYIDRSIYRLLNESAQDKKTEAGQEARDALGFFQRQIKLATKALPDQATEIAEVSAQLNQAMDGPCGDVLRLGATPNAGDLLSGTQKMHEVCDPALNAVMVDISAITNKLIKLSDAASDRTTETTDQTIKHTYVSILAALLTVSGMAAYLAVTGITRPIKAVAETLGRLSRGDLDIEIPGKERRDEVGVLANAALYFRDQSRETERMRNAADREAAETAARVQRDNQEKSRAAEELAVVVARLGGALKDLSAGDLAARIEGPFSASYATLRDDFNAAIGKLNEAIGSVASSAKIIEAGSRQILTASEDLARRTSSGDAPGVQLRHKGAGARVQLHG